MVGNPIFCYATYGCKFFCRDLRIITDYFKNGFRSVGRSFRSCFRSISRNFRSCFRSVGRGFRSLFDVFLSLRQVSILSGLLFLQLLGCSNHYPSILCDNIGTCTTFFTNSQEYKHLWITGFLHTLCPPS